MKTIAILSPDTWGKMMLSKMHFAKELATEGNNVFFVNPPRKNSAFDTRQVEPNLTIVSLKENPLRVFSREKCRTLYRAIEKNYIRKIRKVTGEIDELWCFNAFFIADLKLFNAKKTLLFVYDLYAPENLQEAAKQCDGIVSISQEILDRFKDANKPQLLIHHGLAPAFEQMARSAGPERNTKGKIKIGYVGNLVRPGIDRETFKKIISEHPETEFHFWGPAGVVGNNLITDSPSEEIRQFIDLLRNSYNVTLHGIKSPEELSTEMTEMDAFLFLYDAQKDVNAGLNSHKLTEYLATGKVIFSPYVSRFADTGLIVMDEKGGGDFSTFFSNHLKKIDEYNKPDLQQKRIHFALENTYKKQIERIRDWMNKLY